MLRIENSSMVLKENEIPRKAYAASWTKRDWQRVSQRRNLKIGQQWWIYWFSTIYSEKPEEESGPLISGAFVTESFTKYEKFIQSFAFSSSLKLKLRNFLW